MRSFKKPIRTFGVGILNVCS